MATAHPDRNLISSSDVEGTSVYDTGRKSIGSVDHLMIDKASDQVRHAVISFGGFLGLAERHHPLPWSALRYDVGLGCYVTSVTQDQLRDAPAFRDSSWTDRTWETQTHRHYGARPHSDDVRPGT
jgi:hypothetical protein